MASPSIPKWETPSYRRDDPASGRSILAARPPLALALKGFAAPCPPLPPTVNSAALPSVGARSCRMSASLTYMRSAPYFPSRAKIEPSFRLPQQGQKIVAGIGGGFVRSDSAQSLRTQRCIFATDGRCPSPSLSIRWSDRESLSGGVIPPSGTRRRVGTVAHLIHVRSFRPSGRKERRARHLRGHQAFDPPAAFGRGPPHRNLRRNLCAQDRRAPPRQAKKAMPAGVEATMPPARPMHADKTPLHPGGE